MERSKVYKHENCRDVAFYVTKLVKKPGTVVATGFWVNLTLSTKGVICQDQIKVNVKDLDRWKEINL